MDSTVVIRPDYMYISYFTFVVLAVNIVTAVHIILNKHDEPVSAVMWLLMIFFTPIVGLLVYLFFGINRIKTRGLNIQSANDSIRDELAKRTAPGADAKKDTGSASRTLSKYARRQSRYNYFVTGGEAYPEYCKMLDRLLPDTIPLIGNQAELLLDGTQAYPEMLSAIRKAKSSVHLQSYIIMNDKFGKTLFTLLREKADKGVEVKVLYDRFGSMRSFMTFFFPNIVSSSKHFEVRPFMQFRPWSIQLRNHRKLLVVDGKEAFIGGINISGDNIERTAGKDRYIHDLHCRVRGPVVGELQFSFLRDWHYVTRMAPSSLLKDEYFPALTIQGESVIWVVASGPGHEYEAVDKVYTTAVMTAKRDVQLMTPYFVPDKAFCKLLCASAAKGVEIKIIVPEKNNHWYIKLASRSLYKPLLEAGVRIFEKKGAFLHAKALLVDGQWAKMGSSNCDVRSFKLNYELDFVVEKGKFVEQLRNQFAKEISESKEILMEDVSRKSIPVQLAENICALFTPIL